MDPKDSRKEYLSQLKEQVMKDLKISLPPKDEYHGEMKTKNAGAMGGPIGGEMVRRMIQQYYQSISKNPAH